MSKVTGVIKRVNPADTRQSPTDPSKNYTTQTIVVTIEPGQYQQDIQFELMPKIQSIADSLREGEEVEISYNLRGRDYTGRDGLTKNYTTLSAWRVDRGTAKAQQPAAAQYDVTPHGQDDLPF